MDRTQPGEFLAKRYPIPADVLQAASEGRGRLRFVATRWLAGGVDDVRLMKSGAEANGTHHAKPM